MKINSIKVALVGYLALVLAACSQVLTPTLPYDTALSPTVILPVVETQTTKTVSSLPIKEPEKGNVQMTQPALPPFSSNLESLIEKAKQDLAQRLGISVDNITVVAVIGQEFSTDSFYCRTTKERIAKEESPQVMSGQNILLSASGRRYEYHASDQLVIFCRPLH